MAPFVETAEVWKKSEGDIFFECNVGGTHFRPRMNANARG